MKKRTKKIIGILSLTLAVLVVSALFSACNANGETASMTDTPSGKSAYTAEGDGVSAAKAEADTTDKRVETPPENKAYIGEGAAKEKALAHAGILAENAFFDRVELDLEQGTRVYEVEFYSAGYDYDYDIDAETGKVLRFEKEYDD